MPTLLNHSYLRSMTIRATSFRTAIILTHNLSCHLWKKPQRHGEEKERKAPLLDFVPPASWLLLCVSVVFPMGGNLGQHIYVGVAGVILKRLFSKWKSATVLVKLSLRSIWRDCHVSVMPDTSQAQLDENCGTLQQKSHLLNSL